MLYPSAAFILFLKRSGLYLLIMSVCRLLFYLLNISYFPSISISDFLQGIRFDALAGVFGLAPFYIMHALPFDFFRNKRVQQGMHLYFLIVVIIFIAVNCIDMIYFRFTLKRTTWDIFHYLSTGNDVATLIPQFLKDFWYVGLIFLALSGLTIYAYKKIKIPERKDGPVAKYFYILIIYLLAFLAGRGGMQLKPLHIIDASRYTQTANVPLVLCTPFTIMKTWNKEHLKEVNYFDESIAASYFNPLLKVSEDSLPQRKNIVIIIMESMAREYVGYFNNDNGYTPFLDSLINKSTVFENAFANGRRSIEALPAIFSGLPNLMNEAFVTSPYSGNKIASLASILKPKGYTSHFFHGGKNGTMGFNSYTRSAGFDHYYGLDEYPLKENYDGNWGVYDAPYFQYVADVQDQMKQPFLTGVFSLSAHHPYSLPEGYVTNCGKARLPIHPTICYADDALKQYFKKIQNEAWYQQTVFIITADHTAQSANAAYNSSRGIYAIPIVLFDPSNPNHRSITKTTQQADIVPTLLDYLNLPCEMICFGQSALDAAPEGCAINYLQDVYQITGDRYTLLFDGKQVLAGGDHIADPLLRKNIFKTNAEYFLPLENKLKAIIQSYNSRMIDNQLTVHD